MSRAAHIVLRCAPLLFSACLPSRGPFVDTGPGPAEPLITGASVSCDAEAASWSFEVDADAWTGGGDLWLSIDGAYVETHELMSTGAAGDGSADHLERELDVVPDFRDVVADSTTLFNCETPGLLGVLRIFRRDGESVSDCRVYGEPDAWNALGLDPTCTTAL